MIDIDPLKSLGGHSERGKPLAQSAAQGKNHIFSQDIEILHSAALHSE